MVFSFSHAFLYFRLLSFSVHHNSLLTQAIDVSESVFKDYGNLGGKKSLTVTREQMERVSIRHGNNYSEAIAVQLYT